MKKPSSLLFALFLGLTVHTVNSSGAVQVASIFGDHMVLQQGQELSVWGWAEPGEKVTVAFDNQTPSAVTAEHGEWEVTLSPLTVSTNPATMTVSGSNEIIFENILVGEVWICSGQSNMEWPVKRAANPKQAAQDGNHPLIRHIKIPKKPSNTPRMTFTADWKVASPETVPEFTAVGYYFALTLMEELNVPIGLINSSWGGTRIETWVNREGLESVEGVSHIGNILRQVKSLDHLSESQKQKISEQLGQLEQYVQETKQFIAAGTYPDEIPQLSELLPPHHQAPSRLYRGMIYPLIPYGIRGAIWYQGESNAGRWNEYADFKEALVQGWRDAWGQGDFPFYWVQLANYQKDHNVPTEDPGWAMIREAQTRAMKIPNTGMAVIMDIGEANDIHPRNKQDVGKRLAQWALTQDYGKDGVPSGPLYSGYAIEGNEIHISFNHVGDGLMIGEKNGLEPVFEDKEGKLKRFIISGEDRNWVWADARIEGDTVVLSSPEVSQPTAARYGFTNNPEGANLYNRNGFPAGPFRTDSE